jgi:DNA-binding SARP family transcriptional activator
MAAEIWNGSQPRSAMATVQTYIMHIRKLFGLAMGDPTCKAAQQVLVREPTGYRLVVDPETLDLYRYERLMATGRQHLTAGKNELAATVLRDALSMWRDPPLVDVSPGPLLEIQVQRLEESRLGTLELRIEADARIGRHHELLSELVAVTAEHRQHEGLHAQLMLALYRSGRRSQALETYRTLRARTVDELGLEPSVWVRRLHQEILRCNPVLDIPAQGQALAILERLGRQAATAS